MTTFTPDVPGRGAWRRQGGLLPIRPTSTSGYGFYRLAVDGETPIGSAWVRGQDRSDSARSVWAGVRELQKRLGVTADGWFGQDTHHALLAKQRDLGVTIDGVCGEATMRVLLRPEMLAAAKRAAIPAWTIGGISIHESALDLGAVGDNGLDHGGMQINLGTGEATWEQAMDYRWALDWSAAQVAAVAARWRGKTTVDPYVIAVANHNSPRAAQQWAQAGHPVDDPGRLFPIEQYVADVKAAWNP